MRLKDFVLFCILSLASFTFSSCEEEKNSINNSWNSGTLNVKDEIFLSGSNNQSLNIKASVKPTVTTDASWLRIGEVKNLTIGLYSVELSADVNVTGETRSAEVSVTAGPEKSIVKVSQESGDMVEIRSVEPQGDLDPDGGTITIKYVATGNPAINIPEWIKPEDTRALNEGVMMLTYSPNNTGKEREGIIVLAVGKTGNANITVRQAARTLAQAPCCGR